MTEQAMSAIAILDSLKFTRFTQYIYKMQTTPNKVIINKL